MIRASGKQIGKMPGKLEEREQTVMGARAKEINS